MVPAKTKLPETQGIILVVVKYAEFISSSSSQAHKTAIKTIFGFEAMIMNETIESIYVNLAGFLLTHFSAVLHFIISYSSKSIGL